MEKMKWGGVAILATSSEKERRMSSSRGILYKERKWGECSLAFTGDFR